MIFVRKAAGKKFARIWKCSAEAYRSGFCEPFFTVDVQIRYRSAAIPATLRKGETPNEWIVCFQSDASAVTPGQSAVIYRNDCIIGGGIIADQRLLKKYAL